MSRYVIITLKSPNSRFQPDGKTLLDPQFQCSHIIHGSNRQYFAEWAGNLSLKAFYNGKAFYNTGAGRYAVDESNYLILNENQPYSITIDAEDKVESFCLFFESGFAGEVHRSLTSNVNQLLDDPEMPTVTSINFVQRLYPLNDFISPLLSSLRSSLAERHEETGWIKEQLHLIMQRLLQTRSNVFAEMEQLSAIRTATREELYRRLYRARDFAAAMFYQPITLDEMAKTACLSPNHFLRNFKKLFGKTPHQYLTGLRLEKAKKLLVQTNLPIIDVCFAVGFESHGSFSWLFRRHFGISPEKYRLQKGDFREAHSREDS